MSDPNKSLAVGAALLALAALASRPAYEGFDWRSALPPLIRESAIVLPVDTSVIGSFDGTEGYYAIRPSSDRRVRVSLSSGYFDPIVVIYKVVRESASLMQVARDDDSGEGNDALATICMASGTIYVIGVNSYGSSGRTGGFTLRLSAEEADCGESPMASAAAPTENTMQQAYLAAMRSDLRNLVTAEESYFADNVTYTSNLGPTFTASSGVTVEIGYATGTGWRATARHARTGSTCSIFMGGGQVAAPGEAQEGIPFCTER